MQRVVLRTCHRAEMPPELTEEDEDILDRIWAREAERERMRKTS